MRQQARALLSLAVLLGASGCSTTPLPEACYLPPASGACPERLERYFFDAASGRCKAFIWGGCDGTVPFNTRQQCERTCLPPAQQESAP